MKKLLLLLCIVLSFECINCCAFEETTVTLAENIEDNELIVDINISEESKICGGKIDITYDDALISASEYEIGELLSGYSCFVNLQYKDNIVRISWAGVTELSEAGTLCTLKFDIKENRGFSSDINIAYSKFANADGNAIPVESKGCTINYDVLKEPSANSSTGSSYVSGSSKGNKKNEVAETTLEKDVAKQTTKLFNDVDTSDWFYDSVKYVSEAKLMIGTSDTEFAPSGNVTRAMLVTILYRNEGNPAVDKITPFIDVNSGTWYFDAVSWAKQNGIVYGVSDIEFAPDMHITREQIATIMFRYAQYKGMKNVVTLENLHFTDINEISDYAVSAVNWAVASDLMTGKSSETINPKDNATRAEIAAIFQRYNVNVKNE